MPSMKKLAFLEYAFIFDPDSTWANVYDFENKLGEFFKALGYEANIIDAIKGHVGRRVIFITKIQDQLGDPNKNWREKKGQKPQFQHVRKVKL